MYGNRGLTLMVVGGAILLGSQALALTTIHPAPGRRQMIQQIIGCMKKRMSADRVISYNDARAVCKDQIGKRSATLTAATLAPTDKPTRP